MILECVGCDSAYEQTEDLPGSGGLECQACGEAFCPFCVCYHMSEEPAPTKPGFTCGPCRSEGE